MIYTNVEELLAYAVKNKLIEESDCIWARNSVLEALNLPDNNYAPSYKGPVPAFPSEILADISFYAAENNLLKADTQTYREIFETKIMALFTARPAVVTEKFLTLLKNGKSGPKKAMDFFYNYCQKVYYVKADRAAQNINWKVDTNFGFLDMTINMSKPEKDPKEIALQGRMKEQKTIYPKCLLCRDNEGYSGRLNHPARQNLRLIPLKLNGETWYFQYSPYVYYREHSILLSEHHRPMKIDGSSIKVLLDFVEMFPHYFIGSNADLPIVGGSILSHDHFQAGRCVFPLEKAGSVKSFKLKKFPRVSFDIIRWPLSVIRARGKKKDVLASAEHILNVWKKYDDKKVGIIHSSGKTPHNTVTPIVRFKKGKFEADIILRNNRCDKENPYGIFHSPRKYHNIKRENIGLIEAMGMAILPARLKAEMSAIAALLARGEMEKMKDLSSLAQHYNWVKEFIGEYKNFGPQDIMDILLEEIGQTFCKILLKCGVFKHDAAGKEALLRFIEKLDK